MSQGQTGRTDMEGEALDENTQQTLDFINEMGQNE